MAGSISRKHLNKNFELVGIASSDTNYLSLIRKDSAAEGMTYYDTTDNQLKTYDGSVWSPAGLSSQSAGSLENAASIGTLMTSYAIEIQNESGTDLVNLTLDQNDNTNNPVVLQLENAGTGVSVDIDGTNGKDIDGTGSSWYVDSSGVALLTGLDLVDGKNIRLGGSQDVVIDYNDGSVGTSGVGLCFEPIADDVMIFGTSDFSFNVWFVGQEDYDNRMEWDLDGGADSLGALLFKNTDIDLTDSDLIRFGTHNDVTVGYVDSGDKFNILHDGGVFCIGATGAGMDMFWYSTTASKWVYFDESNKVVDFVDIDINLDDNARLFIGSNDDWSIGGTTSLTFLPGATSSVITVGNSAGDKIADLNYYTDTAGAGFFIDASVDEVKLYLADLRLGDDDYILLGADATAGAGADGTIRWAGTSSLIEIVGDTLFKDAVTVDGNLTISGTLSVTGAWDPASFALADDEYITFGTGPDFKILHQASASINALQISACAANDVIRFGNGLVDLDVIFAENASTTKANFWWDGSGTEIFVGYDDKGLDMTWYAEQASQYMKWDQDANTNYGQLIFEGSTILMNDDAEVFFGDSMDWWIMSSGTNLIIDATAAGAAVQFGAVNEGCDVNFYGTTDGYDCTWDQGADCLYFADNAELCIGAGAGVGTADLSIWSNGTSTSIEIEVPLHIATNANANGKNITFGHSGTNGTDVTFVYGASSGHYAKVDAGASTFILKNIQQSFVGGGSNVVHTVNVATGSGALCFAATDHADARVWFGTSVASQTNGLDVLFKNKSGTNGIVWDVGSTTFTLGYHVNMILNGASDVAYTIGAGTGATCSGVLLIAATDTSIAKVQFGASGATTNGLDVIITNASGESSIVWDAASTTFTFAEPAQLVFSGSSCHYTINHLTDSGALHIQCTDSSQAKVVFGSSAASQTNGLDVDILTCSGQSAITWDAGATTFTLADPTQLIFTSSTVAYTLNTGTDSDFLKIGATDSDRAKVQFGISTATTNGLDVQFYGKTTSGMIAWDAGTTTASWTWTGIEQKILAGGTSMTLYSIYSDSNNSDALTIEPTDTTVSRVLFGVSAATTNGLDVQFTSASGTGCVKWTAAASMAIWLEHGIEHQICAGEGTSAIYSIYSDSNTGHALRITTTTDTAPAKIIFGSSGYTTNGLDVTFLLASDSSYIAIDAGSSTFTIGHPVQQIFAASEVNYTINTDSGATDALTIFVATDTSVAKVMFGDTGTNTNGLDVWFNAASGDCQLKWDAGAGTLTTHTTGVSIVVQGSSGIWESGLCIPVYAKEPNTGATPGSIGYDLNASKMCFYNGSAWVKLANAMAS